MADDARPSTALERPAFLTREELLALSAARIASHYREVVRWVRSLPVSEQWQHGEYQGLVQRAFTVASESERSVTP